MSLERLLKQLPTRYWLQLSQSWLREISAIDPPGARPPDLVQNEEFAAALESEVTVGSKSYESKSASVPGLRGVVFHEGIYWLHKSIHSFGAAQSKIRDGRLTWSTLDSYMASNFAMKAICAMLGVVTCDFRGKSYIVDLCRDFGKTRANVRMTESAFSAEVNFFSIKVRFDHRQSWEVFQRLLRVVKEEPWATILSQHLISIPSSKFSHHRNRICYYAHEWLQEDLHEPASERVEVDDRFHRTDDPVGFIDSLDATFYVALALVEAALALYYDVARVATVLNEETDLFKRSLDAERHPYCSEHLLAIFRTSAAA